ncbi:MAG: 50S ribosomal protein L30 [Bacteroidales bacterium]|jgi:large subunit ribosomal protein L30|nr:50S ribosomal protein L30 [Bacteroidales bacterium]
MKRIRITQVRSKIGRPENQKRVLESLGLRKLNQSVEHDASKPILGMVDKVRHLVKVEEI